MRTEAFPKLEAPVALTADEASVVVPALELEQGRELVGRVIHDGILRPFDIANASVDEVRLLFVPFWCIVVTIEGLSEPSPPSSLAERPFPAPQGGLNEVAITICARRAFPYEPKLPSRLGVIRGEAALEIGLDEMRPYEEVETSLVRGEVVEPDLDRAHAEGIATGMLFRAWPLAAALSAVYAPRVKDARFCLYPLYFAQYTYDGEARRRPREELFVAVSGVTGALVAATHPSAARAVAAKVRRLLSLDRRV